jgi:NAD(P)-dependent dehydrogenase (short-subunit alcohol dehydrogenase family)
MLSDMSGKRALVTGAARGLGRAIAALLVARGARVLLADLDGDEAAQVAADLGAAAQAIRCDVADSAQVAVAVAAAVERWDGLDILVNNAGMEIGKPLVEHGDEEFGRLLDVNVKGVFHGIKHATPVLARQGGAIVNMASVAGLAGAPLLGAYCASKAAVLRMTEVAAIELRDLRIRVNAVCPAFIGTPMVDRLVPQFEAATGIPFGTLVAQKQQRLGTPEEVAEMAVFLASDDAEFLNGAHYTLDGGLTGSLL